MGAGNLIFSHKEVLICYNVNYCIKGFFLVKGMNLL